MSLPIVSIAMLAEPPATDPVRVAPDDLVRPDAPAISFAGFSEKAFAILDRLRAHPHIEQYREEKPGIKRHLKEPFKVYRDDLVVNWVLPNRLLFETERNVFSRLLKNDFGAGGCHHHLWMAFYRPGYKRLTDVQLSHSIGPEGLDVGLFVGGYAKDLLQHAQTQIERAPQVFRDLVNDRLDRPDWRFAFRTGPRERYVFEDPLASLPDELDRTDGLWVRHRLHRGRVIEARGQIVAPALGALHALWPLYRFLTAPLEA